MGVCEQLSIVVPKLSVAPDPGGFHGWAQEKAYSTTIERGMRRRKAASAATGMPLDTKGALPMPDSSQRGSKNGDMLACDDERGGSDGGSNASDILHTNEAVEQVSGDEGEGRPESEDGEAGVRPATHGEPQADDAAANPSRKKVLSAKKLAKFQEKHAKRGIVYMSRVPPHLKPLRLRQMLEPHAKLGRIYMAPVARPPRGEVGKKRQARSGKEFSEGWIEFEDKRMARAVSEMLNGQPMGGKHRSKYRDDLWTLKYLPKFKWDHLTEEIAHQKAVREKKLAQELSSAKRERDFYLSKVAQAKKSEAILERKRKRGSELPDDSSNKYARHFHQREPKAQGASGQPGQVSKSLLSMFASS